MTEIPDARTQAQVRVREARDHAASHGLTLEMIDDTPIVPDEHCPQLTWSGTWRQVDDLIVWLRAHGAGWVNLRFALESDGTAIVRYEARPTADLRHDPRLPAVNGGFDCHRSVSPDEMSRLHSHQPAGAIDPLTDR